MGDEAEPTPGAGNVEEPLDIIRSEHPITNKKVHPCIIKVIKR